MVYQINRLFPLDDQEEYFVLELTSGMVFTDRFQQAGIVGITIRLISRRQALPLLGKSRVNKHEIPDQDIPPEVCRQHLTNPAVLTRIREYPHRLANASTKVQPGLFPPAEQIAELLRLPEQRADVDADLFQQSDDSQPDLPPLEEQRASIPDELFEDL
jgi:hypothetical protein